MKFDTLLTYYELLCICIGTDKPTLKLLHKHVKDEVATKWRDLGVELLEEESRHMLNIFEVDRNGVQECCSRMFDYWLEIDTEASWNALINALEEIGEKVLAAKIKKDVLKGISFSSRLAS